MVDADRRLPGHVHAAAGHHHRERGTARHPAVTARQLLRPPVGRRRLLPHPGLPAAHRGQPRRHVRPQEALCDRADDLQSRVTALRPRRQWADAATLPGHPGGRRLHHVLGLTRPARGRVPRRGPRVAFGIWGTITGLAVAIGPLLGGVLTTGLSWEWIFYVNLPIGAIAVAITLVKVAESRQPGARHPDWPGFVLFTAAVSSLVYALIQSSHDSFSDPVGIACLTAAFVLMIAFVVVELRTAQAMFDRSLFRKPTFTGGLVAAFGLSASILSMLLYLVLYLQDVLGYSALGAGMRLLLISAGILVVSTISGRLSSRMPVRFLIGPGLLLIGGGLLWIRGLNASSDWTHLIPGMIMSGAGLGLVNPPLASTAVGVVQPAHAGMASGINSTFRQIGIATGIALLGTLFSSKIKSYVTDHIGAIPGVGDFGPQISTAVQSGTVTEALGSLPPEVRAPVKDLATAAFTSGLNEILLVAALIALVAGVVSLATIHTKDFVQAPS
ncbi:MFS transporter [Streptomyces sp. S4.7]|uniref:MFS transporter n=1 Tax=Streptomyces sp. S4.7 TaxID=2705439 RepID=UPI0031BA4C12